MANLIWFPTLWKTLSYSNVIFQKEEKLKMNKLTLFATKPSMLKNYFVFNFNFSFTIVLECLTVVFISLLGQVFTWKLNMEESVKNEALKNSHISFPGHTYVGTLLLILPYRKEIGESSMNFVTKWLWWFQIKFILFPLE